LGAAVIQLKKGVMGDLIVGTYSAPSPSAFALPRKEDQEIHFRFPWTI